MAWRSASTYILVVLLNPLGVEPVVPESALARVGLVSFAAINAARRMRTRLPHRGSLGRVLWVTTPSQTIMHVLLMRTSAVSTLAKLGSASSGRVPEVPAVLAYQDSRMGGGGRTSQSPTYSVRSLRTPGGLHVEWTGSCARFAWFGRRLEPPEAFSSAASA